MRLEQLLYFKKVAVTGSISKAADELYISQQALNRSITKLEKEFNATFFERSYNGCFLTADGSYALDIVNQFLSLYSQLYEHFTPTQTDSEKSNLSIISYTSCQNRVLSLILTDFLLKHPDVAFTSSSGNLKIITNKLLDKSFDIGIVNLFAEHVPKAFTGSLVFFPLLDLETVVVISIHSPLAKQKVVSIKQLLKYNYIITPTHYENDNISAFISHLKSYGEVNIISTDSNEIAQKYIEANQGFILEPQHPVLFPAVSSGTLVTKPLSDPIKLTLGYIIHRDNLENPLIQEFVTNLKIKLHH